VVLWRISNFSELSGIGAELASGRWHTRAAGIRVVYLAEHPAVAVIENLANLRGDPRFFQQHFQLLRIAVPDTMTARELNPAQLSAIAEGDIAVTQVIGDAWLAEKASAILRVPSIPSPESWNYLLNPLHPDASLLTVEWARRISYDRRLFHLAAQ
jgi:RES domain-containing protein